MWGIAPWGYLRLKSTHASRVPFPVSFLPKRIRRIDYNNAQKGPVSASAHDKLLASSKAPLLLHSAKLSTVKTMEEKSLQPSAKDTMHPGNVDQSENTVPNGKVDMDRQMFHDAKDATETEHRLTLLDALRLYPKAVGWSVFVSAACVMEGYEHSLPWAAVRRAGLSAPVWGSVQWQLPAYCWLANSAC